MPVVRYKWEILFMLLLSVFLIRAYAFKFGLEGESFPDRFWEFFEPVSGILTLLVTLFILYMQAYKNWEEACEKRVTVRYVYSTDAFKTREVARIENAYLGNSDDIRAWSQSLGRQLLGQLDFDMDWGEIKEKINYREGKWYKEYYTTIYLVSNPWDEEEMEKLRKKKEEFQRSEIIIDTEEQHALWRRKL